MSEVPREPASGLYPEIEPRVTGQLEVGDGHTLAYEECGIATGKPVVFLHGGPGASCGPKHRRFFDPARYRIVLFDQRGCGRSTPHASLEHNTTWDLVADIERLRAHLGIERWQVFGGSWGSTLALAYAERHPGRVTELVLRGIFLVRRREIEWFYQRGADAIFPDAWQPYEEHVPLAERGDLLAAYHRRLVADDPAVQLEAARRWIAWEDATSYLHPEPPESPDPEHDRHDLAMARIEAHYFAHHGFFDADGQLLRDVDRIRHIPATIVQGRYDVVCPITSAWALHRAWPEAEFVIAPESGHSAWEPEISRALAAATDRYADRGVREPGAAARRAG